MTVLSVPSRAAAPVATRRRILVRPSTELTRMTRYRGGTYSHTTDKIVFDHGRGRCKRTLGVGSTLSASSHGRGGRGYRYYRLVARTLDGPTPTIDHAHFWLTGSRHYRNADRIVHLYLYLLAGARKAGQHAEEPQLVDTYARVESDLVGPFQVRIPLTLNTSEGHTLVDADGFIIDDTVQPGTDFYLRRAPGTTATTLTATTPQNPSPKVLIGVAHEQAPQARARFTPVALTMPAHVAIQFDISWDGDCRADMLEKADEHC
ncbi:MAG: hypothetical protein ACLPXZ_00775 [Mycobacterium sp.]